MSFCGKKFKRVAHENIEELLKTTNISDAIIKVLQQGAPTFCFKRLDEKMLQLCLESDDRKLTHTFTLGEEHDMTRRDGSKIRVTYILESDNVLKQIIKQPDGKIAYFRKEFGEKELKMTVTLEGSDVEARIYYQLVE